MVFADLLLIGLIGVFLTLAVQVVLVVRHTWDPGLAIALGLMAFWTLAGAFTILRQKRTLGGAEVNYIEGRLFPVLVDGVYAQTLLAYSLFVTGVALVVWVCTRARRPRDGMGAWERLARHFSHPVVVVGTTVATVLRLAVARILVADSSGSSLYVATRMAHGEGSASAGLIRIYQYLNNASSYTLACALTLWLCFPGSRHSYRRTTRLLITLSYAALIVVLLAENAVLGNRAVPLQLFMALAVGWLRWVLVPSEGARRAALALRFGVVAVAGVMTVALIGLSRGGSLSSPSAVLSTLAVNAGRVGELVSSITGSTEKFASHISLYGVLRQTYLERHPLAASSYASYASVVQAPSDQGFTVHYVTAWWLRAGGLGLPLGIALFAGLLIVIQRMAWGPNSLVVGAFALPATLVTALGAPVTMLRSGPEAVRSVLVEQITLPGLACLLALLVGARAHHRRSAPLSVPLTLGDTVTLKSTNEVARGLSALRRRWPWALAAAVLGAAVGFGYSTLGNAATYQAVVPTIPPQTEDVLGLLQAQVEPPVQRMVDELSSSTTKSRLGDAVAGSAMTATRSVDKASVEIRVTAPTPGAAERAAAAYAGELSSTYRQSIKAKVDAATVALDQGIARLTPTAGNGAEGASRLAVFEVQKKLLSEVDLTGGGDPSVHELSGGNSPWATALLLALGLGGLTAAVIALLGLRNRTLESVGDIESVTGRGSVVGLLGGQDNWGATVALQRLSGRGRVHLVPLSSAAADALPANVADVVDVSTPFATAAAPPELTGPVVLLTQLGVDDNQHLELADRALRSGGGELAGVIAVAKR